jgi:hypothetical protein
VVGVDVGGVVAGGVLGPVLPVQVTPLSANDEGLVLLPLQEPRKPNDTLPLVSIAGL